MLDHVSVGVSDMGRAKAFYDAALKPLGYERVMDLPEGAGYGAGSPAFWIGVPDRPVQEAPGCHFAFKAPNRAAVDAFHAAAMAAGGRDDGAPGLRPHYHPDYYAAFVVDPDGNRIEAVCRAPA